MKGRGLRWLAVFLVALAVGTSLVAAPRPALAQTIVDEWSTIKAPPPPELKPVTVDPRVTALLIMDILPQNCNPQRRPRCVASVPRIQGLLTQARAKGVAVVYTLAGGATPADIIKEVAPLAGEPVFLSGPDKFFGTDLERVLKERGVSTVITVGVAAHGAVLYTASGAALRGLKVIVPVDGMAAEHPYAEQYTAWHLVNVARIAAQITLTRTDLIQYR